MILGVDAIPQLGPDENEEVLINAFLYILMGCLEDGSVVTWFAVRNFLMGCSGGGSTVLWRVDLQWLVALARVC